MIDIQELIDSARRQLDGGRAVEAVRLATHALRTRPRCVDAYALRGAALAALREPERADRDFRRALALDPRCADALVGLAEIQVSTGAARVAVGPLVQAALEVVPQSSRAWFLRLSTLPANALWPRVEAMRKLSELEPDHAERHFQLATLLARAGLFEDAIPVVRRFAATAPSDRRRDALLVENAIGRRAFDEARALLDGARPDGWCVDALLRCGRPLAALEMAGRLTSASGPDHIARRCELLQWSGRDAEALAALASLPRSATTEKVRAATACAAGDFERCEARARDGLALDPRDGTLWTLLGEALRRNGRSEAARDAFNRSRSQILGYSVANELNIFLLEDHHWMGSSIWRAIAPCLDVRDASQPPPAEVARLAAVALQRMHGNRSPTPTWVSDAWRSWCPMPSTRYLAAMIQTFVAALPMPEVIDRFDALAAADPGSTHVQTYRAEVRLWWGDYEGAARDCETAIRKDRYARWAWIGLASARVRLGDPAKALAVFEEAERFTDPLVLGLTVRGEALAALGRHREAVEATRRAAELHPSRLGAWMQLATLCPDEAPAITEAIAASNPAFWADIEEDATGRDPVDLARHALASMRGSRSRGRVTYFLKDRTACGFAPRPPLRALALPVRGSCSRT